jgi:head-tail adaptor
MSWGKLNSFIIIGCDEPSKDAEGFAVNTGKPLASVRAYKETRHGNEAWKNRAAFSSATTLFRFRRIPGLTVTTAMHIEYENQRYNIVSVDDVRNRCMYIEVLAELVTASEG